MYHKSIKSICFCLVFWSACCQADTLVITYHSGKTQTIQLDDSIQAISKLNYQPAQTSGADEVKAPVTEISPATGNVVAPAVKPESVVPTPKGKVKFKWAEPMGE